MPETLSTIFPYAVSMWALVIAVLDVQTRRIPNVLTMGAWVIGVVVLLVFGRGALGASSLSCLLSVALGLMVTVPAYALRILGAGDVKLIVAIGVLGGLKVLIAAYVVTGLVTGAMLMVYFFCGGQAQTVRGSGPVGSVRGADKLRCVPFGAALAVGLLCAINLPMDWLVVPTLG